MDHVEALVEQWRAVRPDLELAPMATIGRLGRLHALASARIEAVLREHGLGLGEFDVLAALRRGGPMGPGALARLVMLTAAGMTNRVDRLVAAGLVDRTPDPDDRRAVVVELTAKGRQVVDAAVTDHVAGEAELLAPLTEKERATLDRLVAKLLVPLEP